MANPTSRLTLSRAAIRPEMKGRVMLSGPPGAGKTYTGLVIALALVGPEGRILVVDTEKESSLTYADVFKFDQLRWNPPFDPTSLSLTLREAASVYDCILVDSFSHFWRKQGGVLDIAGGVATGWKEARPIQENLIETVLDIDAHVILCCRSKMDHLIEANGKGGYTVTKMGLKAQQDDDLEYEVNVALEINMPHVLTVSKSRTNEVPVGTEYLAGMAGDFAVQYRDWLRSGEPVASTEDTDALMAALNRITDGADRKVAKFQFLDAFGRPEFILQSRIPEAQAWVADRLMGIAPPADRGPDEVPAEPEGHEQGEGAAEGAQQAPGAGVPPRTAEPATATADPTAEPPTAPTREQVLTISFTDDVMALSTSEVGNHLRERELSRNGTDQVKRQRLIKYLVGEQLELERQADKEAAGDEPAGEEEPEPAAAAG